MPTIPSEQPPRPLGQAHESRRIAESFGQDADRYDRARPRYPDALVSRIIAGGGGSEEGGGPGGRAVRDVLDVGIGTGIVARQFQAAGCAVLGVEPDERMAEFARRAGTEVEVAAFEAWDPGGRGFDAVVAGQAWHWVNPVAGAAKAAAALRPGGLLAVFWNAGRPAPDLAAQFAAVYNRVAPDSLAARGWTGGGQDPYSTLRTQAADGMRQAGGFGEPEQWRFTWEQAYTRAEWLDQLPTQGGHALFQPEEAEQVLAGIGAAIDAAGGGFTMHYTTTAVVARRVS